MRIYQNNCVFIWRTCLAACVGVGYARAVCSHKRITITSFPQICWLARCWYCCCRVCWCMHKHTHKTKLKINISSWRSQPSSWASPSTSNSTGTSTTINTSGRLLVQLYVLWNSYGAANTRNGRCRCLLRIVFSFSVQLSVWYSTVVSHFRIDLFCVFQKLTLLIIAPAVHFRVVGQSFSSVDQFISGAVFDKCRKLSWFDKPISFTSGLRGFIGARPKCWKREK